ncbi:MAG: dipicolinate synthase subunit B [Lawsonibacter sp.]
MENKTIGFAVCGSFCTHARAMEALEQVKARFARVIPIVSECTAATDTRFGCAHELMREMARICDHRVISTIAGAEPIGPQKLLDLLIIAPCTGNTLGKLAAGVTDTSVTMAAKAHLRNGRPILLAPSTNDGLAGSAPSLGRPAQPAGTSISSPSARTTRRGSPPPWCPISPRWPMPPRPLLEGRQLQPLLTAS